MERYLFKICIMGDAGVGKTALFYRFAIGNFLTDYPITIGVDFKRIDMNIDNTEVTFLIYDIGGAASMIDRTPAYFRGAYATILVYYFSFLKMKDKLLLKMELIWQKKMVVLNS